MHSPVQVRSWSCYENAQNGEQKKEAVLYWEPILRRGKR